MSLDGSFRCDAALKLLLVRYPTLQSNPRLSFLSEKGDKLTAEDVVGALAEPFLHPSYTIPIIGCFRPFSRRIVDKAVELLRHIPDLGEDTNKGDLEEMGEDDVCVIDFYARRKKGLRLHEAACMALCRALDLSPFVMGTVLNYFKYSPPPFQRFSVITAGFQPSEQDIILLTRAIRISFRFLLMAPKDFSKLWNWSTIVELVQNSADGGLNGLPITSYNLLDIKWCMVQIVAVVLRMSDRATTSFGLQADESLACFFRWDEFCQDTAIEKASWYFQANDCEASEYSDQRNTFCAWNFFGIQLSALHPCNEGMRSKPREHAGFSDLNMDRSSFVLTSALQKSYEMVLMAISQNWPVLLHGPPGVGKTALINMLSATYGSKVLFIQMDDQMDSKTLIGSYICAEQPGEFRWQPGSLTQAVVNGLWVVFEDIDKAPSEVQSTLLPLLEGSNSFAVGTGEAVNVDERFRLFATISNVKQDCVHGKFNFSAFWRKVMVGIPSREDMVVIVNKRYPCLMPYAMEVLDTFEKVNSIAYNTMGAFESGSGALSCCFNMFSLRHLLKFCKRIADLGCCLYGDKLLLSDCRKVFQEAVDIFASFLASTSHRLFMMREIAKIWNIPLTEAERLYPPDKPILESSRLTFQVGRATLQTIHENMYHQSRSFVNLRRALHILEKIACCVKYDEPILLVGETGTGKTTLVQNLASRLGQQLVVLNLSQQSDVADLLGGFKPSDACSICVPLHHEFVNLFCRTFKKRANENRLHYYEKYIMEKKWKILLSALQKCVHDVLLLLLKEKEPSTGTKRKRHLDSDILEAWEHLSVKLNLAQNTISGSSGIMFSFVEGAFVNALRNGHWILLDEVNLAPPEVLQRLTGVLDGEDGALVLAERGDISYVDRHSLFRLFACMNPATDAGKRDLPQSFRSRFTEFFVDEILDEEDLYLFVSQCMDGICCDGKKLHQIVHFYNVAKNESEMHLQDGANQKPQFSLRSLSRALEYTRKAEKQFGFERALYDGFCMFFLTSLDNISGKIMKNMILKILLNGRMPSNVPFDHYFTEQPKFSDISLVNGFMENYVLTESVKGHLGNIARAVYIKRYPVLLQGPTSSGKTSLVRYLASVTGHQFVRINNHDHTDLQEYLGSYVTNCFGGLEFQEGALVKAVRKGYWIVLDELNLAPSEVLEALNRLLDDNRELFIPELQETISAHPDFMLFATQNPPTLYGGRKMLSRAFRNRFLEIHVDEIPEAELSTILEKRCKIPQSHASKMVDIYKDLQQHRQNSKVFAGKHGFITPRDLFKWANRFQMFGKSYEDLAKDGYFLLAERLREVNERRVVQEILEQRLHVKLSLDDLYPHESAIGGDYLDDCRLTSGLGEHANVVWTKSMWRLYFLVERCYQLREPVLLVGDTGGGKTTVCQLLSAVLSLRLHTLNCHQYTESSDFIGGFHPVRDRSGLLAKYKDQIEKLKLTKVFQYFAKDFDIKLDIDQGSSMFAYLNELGKRLKKEPTSFQHFTENDLHDFEHIKLGLLQIQQEWQALFFWQDGPLVQAMKEGDLFLLDEISLADDSVLERLNSVLEPERTLSLAEKGGSFLEKIQAHQNFLVLATMNPGGDYGKKELSPALCNRFTEIWVPPVLDIDELRDIGLQRFYKSELSLYVEPMLKFWDWFNNLQAGRLLTVRDLLSWIDFIIQTEGYLGSSFAFIHGAFLVLLDGLNLGTGMSKYDAAKLQSNCFLFLLEQLKVEGIHLDPMLSKVEDYGWGDAHIHDHGDLFVDLPSDQFGIKPFFISKGCLDATYAGFEFMAPTTCRNTLRLLRAMQLSKPVLLEGSPGVGKTSLVLALARYSGHPVVRINLSEQTDMMDLLGSDLPVDNENQIEFAWSSGVLLQAIVEGSWVLLDELNLAPQSVLEGLNAILDHRGTVYIPELGRSYTCKSSFRIFACQNPSSQGGGRKGLPKSFLNRFTKVYVDELGTDDYLFICQSLYSSIPPEMLGKLIVFNNRIYEDVVLYQKYGQVGSPWEFNLRDIIRSCQIMKDCQGAPEIVRYESFLNVVYGQRMRTADDRREVLNCFGDVFGIKPFADVSPRININPKCLAIGTSCIARNYYQPAKFMKSDFVISKSVAQNLEAILHCIKHQWLCILVGASSSGKTSMIRFLAQISGNSLNELNLSSGTDVSELLGCFEQYNAFNCCKMIIADIERYVYEYCSLRLRTKWEGLINDRMLLINGWLTFLGSFGKSSSARNFAAQLDQLVEIIGQLKLDLERYKLPVSWSMDDLNKSLRTITKVLKNNKLQKSAKFEWVSGRLLKAIECGEWVVLDNANLCSPTVLDRINSLVEPDGLIIVNESGLIDGKPLVLRPHSNFRIFLTLDPRYGEVSRAMRNRGVEIFVMEPCLLLEKHNANTKVSIKNDLKRLLVMSGIPQGSLIDIMAEAHMYARESGIHHGVDITLMELTRWVQLFQELLLAGNQPKWSLRLSWEHTYLSSLGEAARNDVIEHVKNLYLSGANWYDFESLQSGSLFLPGGWPVPLNIRRLTWFSHETSIKQNFMYLEFLCAQLASYELNKKCNGLPSIRDIGKFKPLVVPVQLLYRFLFPNVSDLSLSMLNNTEKFAPEVAYKMLQFAANCAFEQATPSDFDLYILCIEWCNSEMQPYCSFLNSYVSIVKKERDHPIWKCIYDCWFKITHYFGLDDNDHQLPLLSYELVELACSSRDVEIYGKLMHEAINCVSLLRLSFQQWNREKQCISEEKKLHPSLIRLFKCLRDLEEDALGMMMESSFLDQLVSIYPTLLDHHTAFWKSISNFQYEHSVVAWNLLKKEALKLQNILPERVNSLLAESLNLNKFSKINFDTSKPMLWLYGGHPLLPKTAEVYGKVLQLFSFCETIFPGTMKLWKQACDNNVVIDVALTTDVELRHLVMKGVCMSSFISIGGYPYNVDTIQVEELYQSLLRRYEHERSNLIVLCKPKNESVLSCNNSGCGCVLSPVSLCERSGLCCWLATCFFSDWNSFTLDIEILQQLSQSTVLSSHEIYELRSSISSLLNHALHYSLESSSRCPMDFAAHQKLLWLLDAWESVDSGHFFLGNFVHEMWFKWHSSLWTCYSEPFEKYIPSFSAEFFLLLQPMRIATMEKFQNCPPIVDYETHCSKLRVVSRCLEEGGPSGRRLLDVLLSSAQALFQQIIFVHKKSFEDDKFRSLEVIFSSVKKTSLTEDQIHVLESLILCSRHKRLTSLAEFISPLLRELYAESASCDFLHNIGLGWMHIGVLRFYLLFNPVEPDPTFKYIFKHSQIIEKISLLELEAKVRQECENLAGGNSSRGFQKKLKCSIEKYEQMRKKLEDKIVFRDGVVDYNSLKMEISGFMKLVSSCVNIAMGLGDAMDLELLSNKVLSWQDTASKFISILSQKYSSYMDVIQPVQIAIYEMKLGLSLLLTDALQKEYLRKVEEKNFDRIMETIDSFMRFPKYESAAYSNSPFLMPSNSKFYSPGVSLGINRNLLPKMVGASDGNDSVNMVTDVQLKSSVYHVTLFHLVCSLCSSLIIDKNSFLMMCEIFSYFTNMWLGMKGEVKAKEDAELRDIKFRPRAIMVEDVLKVDSSTFGDTDSEENISSQSDEILIEQEFTKWKRTIKESKSLEDDWNSIQESILKNVVIIHNQVFGSSNLFEHPGIFHIADDDKLQFFDDSYKLGIKIVKGLPAVLSSVIEENLVAEHLLHICYEYGKSQNVQRGASRVYNAYKEPNAPAMSKMVKPLVLLQQQFKDLLEEWPDHPGLLKIIDVIDVLLHMPCSAPLSQALMGLHLLLNKAHSLQESFPRVTLKDMLHPIYCLVLSWQKLELECWPSLLDEVQQQHETNAGKLWFALNSVLQKNISGDFHDIIQSMEDFIQMSSIGEFKRRLQLILAFHGQINTGISLKVYASQREKDYLDILYNIFGYYIQFLPFIMEQIDNERKCIEKELIQHLKLFKWGENECSFLSIENFRKIRQKLLKLVKKYNDVLQKPIMVILNHETSLQRNKYSAWLEQKSRSEMNTESVPFPIDIIKFSNTERFSWYNVWKHKFLTKESSINVKSLYTTEICDEFEKFQADWEGMFIVLENICHNAAEFAEVWKHESKKLKKRRTLADLLKNLEKCGLSRHRILTSELEFGKKLLSNSFLQSSFDVWHLLLMEGASEEKFSFKWITANQYYFKNLAMKQHLRQLSFNFHKDLILEQVHRGASFVDHLLQIQQEQRSVLYMFSEKMNTLKKLLCSLQHIGTGNGCLSHCQHPFVEFMWKQKNIFDGLHNLSCDASLFLHCVGDIHSNNCNAVQTKINFCSLIQRYIPSFLQSKELLAKHLLGRCGVISASKFVSHTIISKEIEDFVMQNFQLINRFSKEIETFHTTDPPSRSMKMLINHFKELSDKGVMALYELQIELNRCQSMEPFVDGSASVEIFLRHKHEYAQAYNDGNEVLSEASKKLLSLFKCESAVSLAADISSWKFFFESYIANLNLDHLHDALTKIVVAGVRLLNYPGYEKSEVCSEVAMHFKDIYAFLDNFVAIGDGILSEMLSVHNTVAEMSYMLGHIFASLFSKGFGDAEVELDDTSNGRLQDTTGTGLGEGEGLKDVSDQIDDGAQIPDVSDEKGEGLEKSSKMLGTNEKGIEMDEDFSAEMSSVSDVSNDDEGKEEDIHLESLMGENTEGSEAIKEKLWDNDEDGCQDDPKERYGNGSSIEDKDSGSRELRAKDDKTEAVDDSSELHDKNDRSNGEAESSCSLDDEENFADMMDKSNAFEETSGIQLNDQEDGTDATEETNEPPSTTEEIDEDKHDIDDERKGSHMDEETEIDPNEMDKYDSERNSGPVDKMDEDESGKHDVDNATNEGKEKISDILDLKSMGINEGSIHQGMVESPYNPAVGTDAAEPLDCSHIDESNITSSIHQPNSSESFLSPFGGLPSFDASKMESTLSDSTGNLKVDDSQQKSQLDNQSTQRINPNPYRNVGDALKEWKERVKISSDSQEVGRGIPEDMNDENADEYRFISEEENGISQALGPAMAEQVANHVEPMEHDADRDHTKQTDDVDMMDVLNEDCERRMGGMSNASTLKPEIEKHETLATIDLPMEDPYSNISKNSFGDFVSLGREFMNNNCLNGNLLSSSQSLWKALESETVSDEMKDRAISEWRRYEFITTKLSQVLAEQLRLVMEPTLASKLQGDYKTGKRINMKKVIPYIASHFRKDKIWLRRTRPNKRDYQVVVAIDDSRSMSESHCGNVALEALITVCRAMSQLEVGQLAVTSFGEKGNIRLLHSFDQPFTGEAGVQMISSLSFKKENTILDEPMVDLLMYLNSMLDSAVAKARLPSGNSPLQQLILIIADGRFHEKEKLKRYVRDVLGRKRMIAFILLDSPDESIMDLMEASFQDEKVTFTKYMNSFPFPYYVVLRDIESLPRTLGDLLRQWFELMQNSANE